MCELSRVSTKVCKKCLEELPLSCFTKQPNGRIDHSPYCRKCRSSSQKTKRKENTHNAILHLGGKCNHCGLQYDGTNSVVFDFHHINPQLKSFGLSKNSNRSPHIFMQEVEKCMLLCANCHRLLHNKDRVSVS
jgi:predicted HNH restriction endonuclease